MILEITNADGSFTRLYNPYFMKINSSLENNTDTLTATFKELAEFGNFKYVRVIYDEKTIFTGVIDSVINTTDENGRQLVLECRSMSACLIDNHIQPQNMQNITDEIIYQRFLKPFNIGISRVTNQLCTGIMNFGKNTSIYEVVRAYSVNTFLSEPYININGVAILNGEINSNSFYFSNLHNPLTLNSYYCNSISVMKNRRGIISRFYVKNSAKETGYNLVVENENAGILGAECVRFLDATPHSGNCPYDANRMIEKSNQQSLVYTVKCPCLVYNPVGGNAVLDIDGKIYENLIIKSVAYTYSNSNIESEIKMYRK